MKAVRILSQNISALLAARRQSQHDLAQWCHHSDVWISYFLSGKREIQLADLDRIADFFGIATYQLFQPGISQLTERRLGVERRKGADRRIGHQQREVLDLAARVNPARPPSRKGSHAAAALVNPIAEELRRLTSEHERRIHQLLSQAQSRGQDAAVGRHRAGVRKGRGTPRGPDAEEV